MYCVKTRHSIEDHIKKSRFIGMIFPCPNEVSVDCELQTLHSAYKDASHIVFAYRLNTPLGVVYRYSDAGEPSGTAGKPIYQHLEGKNLIDVLLVVIRYYGGIKLGAGGLLRAYSNAARRVIDETELLPFVERVQFNLALTYNQLQPLEYLLKKLDGHIVTQSFGEKVEVTIELPAVHLPELHKCFPCLK